jgi:hypothetical protein
MAYVSPQYNPLDPFHLFYENETAYYWDLWTVGSSRDEPVHISAAKAAQFGQLVVEGMSTLPASFCGRVRDPHLKRHSQYKIYEWMALLHWYLLPIGIELGFNPALLQNLSYYVEAVEMAMTIKPRSEDELQKLHALIKEFLKGYQKLYVGQDPTRISRFRLCIFQLIHVPAHIRWNGSIRLGSQATVERTIGELGHKIRSKKSPFANLANIILYKELVKLLLLYYPTLVSNQPKAPKIMAPAKQIKIPKKERQASGGIFIQHLEAICKALRKNFDPNLELRRWGKLHISDKVVLRSWLGETRGKPPTRSARYFEATAHGISQPIFGEALAFYEVTETHKLLVVYHPIINLQQQLGRWKGNWSQNIEVLSASALRDKIGIWTWNENVHILRKHPALDYLKPEERGAEEEGEGEEEEEEEEEEEGGGD